MGLSLKSIQDLQRPCRYTIPEVAQERMEPPRNGVAVQICGTKLYVVGVLFRGVWLSVIPCCCSYPSFVSEFCKCDGVAQDSLLCLLHIGSCGNRCCSNSSWYAKQSNF
jgi:hypothetical protein